MAPVPVGERAFDRSEYEKADQYFKLVEQKLPSEAVASLAQEVVRRLRFRMPNTGRREDLPTREEIDVLCTALLSPDDDAADNYILQVRSDGTNAQTIYLGYVAGAARQLGEMWETDALSFIDVTLASAKLYRIIRGLRHIVAPGIANGRDEKPALFALVPGETHTLGIAMATDIFRREGWDVDMLVGLEHDVLVDQAERRSYSAVVLIANSDIMMEPLTKLILALRITQPLAHIVIAGNIIDHYPDIVHNVGADAVMKNIETAVTTLNTVIDAPLG